MALNFKGFFLRLSFFLFLLSSTVQADWNQNFDEQSISLVQQLPALQNRDYNRQYHSFKKARSTLLKDHSLIRKMQNSALNAKFIIKKEKLNLIIKKRRDNHINDLYPWELSYITGSNEFIVPSFPFEIGEKKVIVQMLESFKFGRLKGGGYPPGMLKKVSLENYWKALLQAYILGLSDLAATNIGVNNQGMIRFFDTEGCFSYDNTPIKTSISFKPGFFCHAFDWDQYSEPLDKLTAKHLRKFIEGLLHFEEDLNIYLTYRPIDFPKEGLWERLKKIRNFKIQKGVSFRDFIAWIYPKMSPGLDELSLIVGSILKNRVGHGTSIFFASRWLTRYELSLREKLAIQNWVNKYID